MIWFTEATFGEYLAKHYPADQVQDVRVLVAKWLERGDGAAVYENADLGSPEAGQPRIASFGSSAAVLETDEPPVTLPDLVMPGASHINWRYQLIGRYRREWLVTDSKDADGNDVTVGGHSPELGRFFTHDEAAQFLTELPEVETGRYSIDGPPGCDGQRPMGSDTPALKEKGTVTLDEIRRCTPEDAAIIDALAEARTFFYDGPGVILPSGRQMDGKGMRTLIKEAGYDPLTRDGERNDPDSPKFWGRD
jgi:hypothetical protein